MKIAFNVKQFSPNGGAQTYFAYLARELLVEGHQVDVFAMDGARDFAGVGFHRVRIGCRPKWLRDYSFAVKSARMLREAGYDIVFGEQKTFDVDVVRPGGGVWEEYIEREVRSYRGQPWRGWLKRLSLKERLSLAIERRLYGSPRLKRVIVNSAMTKAAILQRYGFPEARIHVVYNGVDTERYSPARRVEDRDLARAEYGLAEDETALVFVAQNFRLKGLAPLIEALGKVKQTGARFRLLVAGKGRSRRYRALARRLGLGDAVRFLGEVRPVDPLYIAGDALVHPTFHDPCANVCLEAMAMGLPVLTTAANGASELIEDGREGFVIPDPLDVDLMADRVARLADPDLRARQGQAARQAVAPLTPRRNAEGVLHVMRLALEER